MKLPTITIFRDKTDFFGKSLEQEIEVNPNNFYPFERTGYYGLCMSCGADLRKGDWYEVVGRGERHWCCECVEMILTQPDTSA